MVAEAASWYGHPEVRSRAFTEVGTAQESVAKHLAVACMLVCWLVSTSLQHSPGLGQLVYVAELIQTVGAGNDAL
jgi:hypothetical protein